MTNYEIAQEINNRIGDVPVTDSLYEAALTIYQQLGGEVSEFDDVYSILQSIKEIARPGGDPITKVSVLPKSGEEYETKFLRTPDDKIYTTGKVTMPAIYTNRLPDAQQIDKAYIYTIEDEPSYYKGAYHIICSDGEIDGYMWYQHFEDDTDYFILTNKSAEVITNTDNMSDFNEAINGRIDEGTRTIDLGETSVNNLFVIALGNSSVVIPATYNAPEANQIGNAYFNNSGDSPFIYKGELEVECTNGNAIFYYWQAYDEWDSTYLTKIPASEIVSDTTGEYCATKFNFFTNMNIDSVTMQYNGTVDDCYSKFDSSSYYIGYVVEDGGGLYIAQLNASDAEQIGKAYIDAPDYKYTYTGEQTTITVDGEELSVYVWYDAAGDDTMYSNKRASEIYNTYKDVDDVHFYCIVDDEYVESTFEGGDFYGIITVKYQRLDKPQYALYGWQQVTVNGLILDEPVKKRYLLRGADLPSMRNEYGLTLREAWVNFNDETYTFNGKTYYKWIKYDDVYEEWKDGRKDAPSTPDGYITGNSEIWMLTTTLTPKLPFTLKSPECAYVITTNGETSEGGNYVILDRECPKMAIEYTNGIISYFD